MKRLKLLPDNKILNWRKERGNNLFAYLIYNWIGKISTNRVFSFLNAYYIYFPSSYLRFRGTETRQGKSSGVP